MPKRPARDFESHWPKRISLRPRLKQILAANFAKPEGSVRAEWVRRLIEEYGFDQEQLDLEVPAGAGRSADKGDVTADIVAYRDKGRKQPFIVVETKAPTEKSGIKQAESYARNLGAEYHIWSNGTTDRFYRTAKYINESQVVGNVPSWVGDEPVAKFLSKKHEQTLPPFRDEPHLRTVVKTCHDRIFFQLGHDPAQAFDELMKMLFLKLYDERETPAHYKFMVVADESEAETASRIRDLFQQSIGSRKYKDVFTTKFTNGHPPALDLDDSTIAFIVKHFQGFSLVNTTATLEGADVKGTVFEQMVGGTFRGELGAYFTPREIVDFMVSMLQPTRNDVVLDPSCGSGGFLIMVLKHMVERIRRESPNLSPADLLAELKEFAKNNEFGVDLNERMARVTKMNMIMHGDGHGGIFHNNGLNIGSTAEIPLQFGEVTLILSNPPFRGRESDPDQLAKFDVALAENGKVVTVHKALPFVELIVKLLKDGGRAGMVLPGGIFNSQSHHFQKIREILWQHCEIRAIIGLPHWVFFHTGCDVQGALLFIEKKRKPRSDYQVFIDWAEHVGYDTVGKKTGKNDFPEILKRYRKPPNKTLFSAALLKKRGRIDPLYYQPGDHAKKLLNAQQSERAVPLTDLVERTSEFVSRAKGKKAKVQYFAVEDTDMQTGAILGAKPYAIEELPSRAKFIVRENNLLLPNHRNSIKAGRSVVLVPKEADGFIATSRFICVRSRVPALYLYYILNLPFIKEAMLRLVSGSSSTEVKFEQLKEIYVPVPADDDFDLLIDQITTLRSEIADLEAATAKSRQRLEGIFSELYD